MTTITAGQLAEIQARGGLLAHKQVIFNATSGNGAAPVAATVTLTSTNAANATNNKTVTIGTHVYTFKTVLTGAADEVFIGASADTTLANLVLAINAGAGAGTNYGTGTVVNADVSAGAVGSHATLLTSTVTTAAGNSVAVSTNETTYSFGTATLVGGKTGTINLFTVTGQVLVALIAVGTATLTGASATLKAGNSTTSTRYLPSLTATTFTVGKTEDLTGLVTAGTAIAKTPNQVAFDGESIIATVGTADVTGGTLDYYVIYFPLSDGALVQ